MFLVVNEKGQAREVLRVAHDREIYRQFLARLPPRSTIAVEASGSYSWLVDEMEWLGHCPKLSNPRPEVVLACEPINLDIVLERVNLDAADQFDLIVDTNIFVYYDAFEQALALENVGAMLKPGGMLLTNDRLPTVPGGSMRLAGITVVPHNFPGVSIDRVYRDGIA